MDYKMVMDSSDGMMGLSTEEIITTDKGKAMGNFTMPKTPASVEVFGRKVFYRVKGSMFKAKTNASNAFGVKENL